MNIRHKSDGTIESLDVKYLSSGEIASVSDLSLIKPYQQHKFLRKSKVEHEKKDTKKSSEKLETTVKQEKKTEEMKENEKFSEKLETTEKQEKKTEEMQEKISVKQEAEEMQEPAEKEDYAGLTRQALKFVERRQARRNLSPRSSRRRVRRNTKPVVPPKNDVEPETKPEVELESQPEEATLNAESTPKPVTPPENDEEPETKPEAELDSKSEETNLNAESAPEPVDTPQNDEEPETKPEGELESKPDEATLNAELTPSRPSRPLRLASTPDCMKLYEADKHAPIAVPASTPEFMKVYEAAKDASISDPEDTAAGSTLVEFQATSLPEYNFQATASLPETREVVMREHQTKEINSNNFFDLVSESKKLLNGTNTQKDKNFSADENVLNSAPQDDIAMNRSAEELFPSTPKRSMERKVDTSWAESPCPIFTPKRLLYTDEASPAKTPPRDITPPPTRRVDGQVMYNTESPSVEIRALVAPHPVSTSPKASPETSSVVSTPRKNNTSSQDATLETLEDTDQSGEMEHDSSLETTLSVTEENAAEENEETKLTATVKMGKTASYLHNLLVGDSYSLDTVSDSLDTASVEETDVASVEETDPSDSYDYKTLSATPAPTEVNTGKENDETKTTTKPKAGGTVSYLHTLLVGDSYSIGTASLEEMNRSSHSYDYNTDQSATDDDMDDRSTCSEALPRSKKMEPDTRFEFCASDTIGADFRMVAKLLARSATLFTGQCPSECRVPPRKRYPKRRKADKPDNVTFDTVGNIKTSTPTATATEGVIDISRLTVRPISNESKGADQYRDYRFAC